MVRRAAVAGQGLARTLPFPCRPHLRGVAPGRLKLTDLRLLTTVTMTTAWLRLLCAFRCVKAKVLRRARGADQRGAHGRAVNVAATRDA